MVWRPEVPGWSDDIHPFYDRVAEKLPQGAHVAEVGVAWGRSILYLAERLLAMGRSDVTLWAIDEWPDEAPEPVFMTEDMAKVVRAYVKVWPIQSQLRALLLNATSYELSMIRIVRATSTQAARMFEGNFLRNGKLDLAFIDAAHDYASVRADLMAWRYTVKSAGVIAGHDYSESFPGVVQAVNESVFRDLSVDGSVWSASP